MNVNTESIKEAMKLLKQRKPWLNRAQIRNLVFEAVRMEKKA